MSKNIIIVLIAILIGIVLPIQSQTQSDDFKIKSKHITRDANQISIALDLTLNEMNIESNDMVILTPTLKSNDLNGEILSLPPIVISGKVRDKIIARKIKLDNTDQLPFKNEPQIILKRENNTSQSVNYNTSVLYKEWMDNASLTIQREISGCANCNQDLGHQLVIQKIFSKPELSSFKLTYIRPNVEPVEDRINNHTAIFNYKVNSYKLLNDYENNNDELVQTEKIIEELKGNKKMEIIGLTIIGYASPEGKYSHNKILAENRANSFVDYLATKLEISGDKITVEGKGEDWESLYKAISNSSLTDRHDILNIIDKVQNQDMRDRQLIKLSNGNTYKTLLRDYYPKLRRTEYVVTYITRSFDVEEARNIIKANPKELNLNEMFLIADSYPTNSEEFKKVFDIAAQIYPNSEISIINSAASDIENKNYDQAIERLRKIEDNPIAWNNLGVAYALKNDIQKAYKYFEKSLNNTEAAANLKTIQDLNKSN